VEKLHAHPSFLHLTPTRRKTENTEEEEEEGEGEGEPGGFLIPPSLSPYSTTCLSYLPTLTSHPAFLPACLALLPSYLPTYLPAYLVFLPTISTYLNGSPFFLPTYLVSLPTFST
jgi:hypothetical protein